MGSQERKNTGKPEVISITKPGELDGLACSETTETGEVLSPRIGWTE